MASTEQKKKSRKMLPLTLEERIQHIIGRAIEHGYNDGREGQQEPSKDYQAFAVALTNELLQSIIEWANQYSISTMQSRKVN